jgi:hypothetical protein
LLVEMSALGVDALLHALLGFDLPGHLPVLLGMAGGGFLRKSRHARVIRIAAIRRDNQDPEYQKPQHSIQFHGSFPLQWANSRASSRCKALRSRTSRTSAIETTRRASELLTETTTMVFNGQVSFGKTWVRRRRRS